MKLKPLGKKLRRNKYMALASIIGMAITFHFGWGIPFWICVVVFIICACNIIQIGSDAFVSKYGLFGDRGPDLLHEYEPGDKEYEEEKQYQE